MPVHLFPENAAAGARELDLMFWALTALSAFILALVFVPLGYFAVKYRRGSAADRTLAKMSTLKFEITWTIIPLVIGLGIFAWAADAYFRIETPPADALHVFVVGKQWMWKLQHEEGNREINELHVPVGRAVVLTLASQDVIHDFFVPAFRTKQDVVPGRYTTEWFIPTKVGRYRIFCAQVLRHQPRIDDRLGGCDGTAGLREMAGDHRPGGNHGAGRRETLHPRGVQRVPRDKFENPRAETGGALRTSRAAERRQDSHRG